jgi:hypothetical protein
MSVLGPKLAGGIKTTDGVFAANLLSSVALDEMARVPLFDKELEDEDDDEEDNDKKIKTKDDNGIYILLCVFIYICIYMYIYIYIYLYINKCMSISI